MYLAYVCLSTGTIQAPCSSAGMLFTLVGPLCTGHDFSCISKCNNLSDKFDARMQGHVGTGINL